MKYNGYLESQLPIDEQRAGYTLHSDGTKWFVTGGYEMGNGGRIRTAGSGAVRMTDGTVLVTGTVTLPDAAAFNHREFKFVYQSGTANINTTGGQQIFLGGSSIGTSYGLNANPGGYGVTMQSDGTNWIVVSRF